MENQIAALILYFFVTYSLAVKKNVFRRNWMLEALLVFSGCSSIQFFNSLPWPNRISDTVGGNIPLTVYLCDLRETMPLHWSPSASLCNPCLGKQMIFLGVASLLTMCLCSHIT